MRFLEYVNLREAPMPPPAPPGGMGMPPPGGMPPIPGGIGGAPLPMGGPPMGGMPPPLGGSPMGGPGGQMPQSKPTEIKTKDVWSLLEKLLSGKKKDNKDTQEKGEEHNKRPTSLRS